jgi:cytochrome P450
MAVPDLFKIPQTLESPFEFFGRLREEEPVFFSETLNAYVVTRFDYVDHILRTPAIFSSYPAGASAQTSAAYAPQYESIYEDLGTFPPLPTLVITDGEVHRRYRAIAERAFAPATVRQLEGKIVALVDALIDAFVEDGRTDLYAALCLKLPSFVMCDVLGFPRDAAPLLKKGADTSPRLTSAALETEETRIQLHRERAEMHRYIQDYIARYTAQPEDNLLSHIIHSPTSDGVPLTMRELISIAGTLNVGGNETTVNGLGNMFYSALTIDGMIDHLRDQPDDIPRLIEESLRLESAVSAMPRRVVEDTELGGVRLPAGSHLFVCFAAANRDDRKFGDPDKADLCRKGIRNHLTFGGGAHFCLGAPLARIELKLAMEGVLRRLDRLMLDPVAPAVQHQSKLVVRGVRSLPVVFQAVRATSEAA